MKAMAPIYRVSITLVLTVLLSSCQDRASSALDLDLELDSTDVGLAETPAELKPLEEAGFQLGTVRDLGTHWQVMGDVHIRKGSIDALSHPTPDGPQLQRLRESCDWLSNLFQNCGPVSQSQVTDVRVVLGSPLDSDVATATQVAVDAWNAVVGSRVHLTIGPPQYTSNEVWVQHIGPDPEACGYGEYPDNGSPGDYIDIPYPPLPGCTGLERWITIMAHELGHTIGFMHTDEWVGHQIAGTPYPGGDPQSVMNSTVRFWGSGFSAYDNVAVRVVYPTGIPDPSVSNYGGKPRISWQPIAGPSGFEVSVSYKPCVWEGGGGTRGGDDGDCENVLEVLGTTTSTSFIDSSRDYTGDYSCVTHYFVKSLFPDGLGGRKGAYYHAPVCP